jgi:hypothetical protein
MTDTPDNTIYGLALHDGMLINKHLGVTRVPGAWLYQNDNGGMAVVPYNPEFKITDKVRKKDALEQLQDLEEGYGLSLQRHL